MGQGANQVSRDEPIRLREGESITIRPDEPGAARRSYDTVDERTSGRAVPAGVAMGNDRDDNSPPQMSGDPATMEAGIERTRNEMSGTIDAIQQRLNPENLKQEAKDTATDLADHAKQAAREAVQHAVDEAKIHAREAIQEVRHAVRGATIGKVEQMARTVSDTSGDTRYGIVETIKQNPIPAALTGIGLAWLLMNRQSAPARPPRRAYYEDRGYSESRVYRGNDYDRYDRDRFEGERYGANYGTSYGASQGMASGTASYRQGQGQGESPSLLGRAQDKVGQAGDTIGNAAGQVGERVGSAAGQVGDTLGNAAGQVGDTIGNAASQVGERVGNMAGQVGETTSSLVGHAQEATGNLMGQAQHGARYVEDRVGRALKETPLAVGAVALALGAAVGLAVPETRKEHELFGAARDNLMEQAQGFAQEAMEKVQGVAGEAGQTVQREAKAQGLTS